MTNTDAQQRAEIRNGCQSIRRLLYSVHPIRALSTVEEVVNIECGALAASGDKLPAVRENLERLIGRLKQTDDGTGTGNKILSPERWKKFFGEK